MKATFPNIRARYYPFPEHFSEENDFSATVPSRTLIIASTPRCGSNMIGHILHKMGVFGFPLEYVNPGLVREWKKRLGTQGIRDTLREVMRRRTSPNGVFGIKMHYVQYKQFGRVAAIRELLPLPHFVLLRRADALSQAISWSLAAQTGEWIEGQRKVQERPHYDRDDINWRLRRVLVDTAAWKYILSYNGFPFIELTYETVLKDIQRAVESVGALIDVNLDGIIIPTQPVTTKQRTSINTEWRNRFLEESDDQELFVDRMSHIVPRHEHRFRMLAQMLRCLVRRSG